jgi:hypothetical protein
MSTRFAQRFPLIEQFTGQGLTIDEICRSIQPYIEWRLLAVDDAGLNVLLQHQGSKAEDEQYIMLLGEAARAWWEQQK